VLGIVLFFLGSGGIVSGGWGMFFKVISFIPLLTGVVGLGLIYGLLKSKPKKLIVRAQIV